MTVVNWCYHQFEKDQQPYSYFFFSISHLPLSFFPSFAFKNSVLSVNATMETSSVAKGKERGIEGGGRARTRGEIKMEVCVGSTMGYGVVITLPDGAERSQGWR